MTTQQMDPIWMGTAAEESMRVPRPRVRGLRMPAIPSWPLLTQLAGGVSALAGMYVQFGSGITLITGGVAAVVLGALRESGRI